MREYKSMEEFKKKFLPKSYRKELIKSMNPEELGKFLADESLREIKKELKKKKRIKLPKKPIYPTWYRPYNYTIIIPWSKPTYTYNGEFRIQE